MQDEVAHGPASKMLTQAAIAGLLVIVFRLETSASAWAVGSIGDEPLTSAVYASMPLAVAKGVY